jgi:hypothetical protein
MGSPLSLIGPAMSLAGGGKGGGGGGGGGDGGGVSPQEMALAQYTQHQRLMEAENQFGNTGTGISTGMTRAAGGTRIAEAMQLAGLSDRNQATIGQLAVKNAEDTGTAAGTAAANQGGFSDQPGSFGSQSDTTGATDQTGTA